jgi:hypothetical protein
LEQQTATLPPASADAQQETVAPNRDAPPATLTLDQTPAAGVRAGVPDASPVPQKIGRFEIRRWLGEGAFGAVYEAYDPQLDRAVASTRPSSDVVLHRRYAVANAGWRQADRAV